MLFLFPQKQTRYQFGCLAGVILPTPPPCFAIPFFELRSEWPLIPPDLKDLCRHESIMYIQNDCSPGDSTWAAFKYDYTVKAVSIKYIESVSLNPPDDKRADFLTKSPGHREDYLPIESQERLYAFAESTQKVHLGHLSPLRTQLSKISLLRKYESNHRKEAESESYGDCFTALELAIFLEDSRLCRTLLEVCFEALAKHGPGMATKWRDRTKEKLKADGIL